MIITQITGGLGNQLFQWAYGYNLSLINNQTLYLDDSFYSRQSKRKYILPTIINFNSLPSITTERPTVNRPTKVINETRTIIKQLNTNFDYYFIGYWQSTIFFSENKAHIIELLRAPTIFMNKFISRLRNNQITVSMHIRRTDYLQSNGFHVVQPLSYYDQAIEIIGHYDELLIFSDDPIWCHQNLSYKNMTIINPNQYNDIETIWLMSMCNHNIIANSSFSWWGAFLNTNPKRKVIAPKIWYGNTDSVCWQDIYNKDWIVV